MSAYQARSLTTAGATAAPRPADTPRLYIAARSAGPTQENSLEVVPDAWPEEIRFPILNEDLAPLAQILNTLGLDAAYREDVESFGLAIPLSHPNGLRQGYLGVVRTQQPSLAGVEAVLDASLALAARAIGERWFRLQHHKRWIVAAAPVADPRRGVLLALDQRLVVQGMDSQATERLLGSSSEVKRTRWEDFFRPVSPLPTLRARTDIPLRLIAAHDGAPWTAILTDPI